MANFIPVDGPVQTVATPLTMTALQKLVGEPIELVELPSGDLMVMNRIAVSNNKNATSIAGRPMYGQIVLCSPEEIA